jgi:hypothetical protein
MSIFKGSFNSSIQENHQFFCDENAEFKVNFITRTNKNQTVFPILKEIGLLSFTKNSFSIIYNDNYKYLTNTSIGRSITRTVESELTFFDYTNGFSSAHITEFNKSAQRFNDVDTDLSWDLIVNLISYHEERQFDSNREEVEFLETWIEKINTSLQKGVLIVGNFFGQGFIQYKLTFYDKNNRSNERKIAFNANVPMVAIPKTSFGTKYSHSKTENTESQGANNIGSIVPAEPGNPFDPTDSVAAPLNLKYNSNNNTWESGTTQILARLLTDVEQPEGLEKLPEDISNTNRSDLRDKLNKFTTGKALPLTVKKGNPYTFGPDYDSCDNDEPIEIIVVNRSPRKFNKDTIVMLSHIDEEWIIQDFGDDGEELSTDTKIGDWHFIKLIANTDTYFKDDRFFSIGDTQFAQSITPQEYEKQSKLKFMTNFREYIAGEPNINFAYRGTQALDIIISLNSDPVLTQGSFFEPSKRYYVSSIFDQLSTDVLGFSPRNYIHATNINDSSIFSSDQQKFAAEMPVFWGPVYSNGHTSVAFNPKGQNNNSPNTFFKNAVRPKENDSDDSDDSEQSTSVSVDTAALPRRGSSLHLPAECSSIFIDCLDIFKNWNALGTAKIFTQNYVYAPFYGTSIPATKNKIQFSPIQAEFVGSDDKFANLSRFRERQFPSIIKNMINSRFELDGDNAINPNGDDSLFGNMYERSINFGYPDGEIQLSTNEIEKCSSTYGVDPTDATGGLASAPQPFKSIKYDCYVTRQPFSANYVGSPQIFGRTSANIGANCVGIISAKNTITKASGGSINFSIIEDYGLNQQRTSTLAQTFLTIIPGIFSAGGSAGGGLQIGIPQWGSTTDAITSFGTTALHVRIFDSWPSEKTVFDPRYFGVLHFNPSEGVDLFIPTRQPQDDDAATSPIVQAGRTINHNTKLMPRNEWVRNTIRRNVLLTSGGFKYLSHQIGLNSIGARIVNGGSGFQGNFKHTISSKGVSLDITVSEGKVTQVAFSDDNPITCHLADEARTKDTKSRGKNFLPADFNTNIPRFEGDNLVGTTDEKAFLVIINPPAGSDQGKPAYIAYPTGLVYFEELEDKPPTEQIPLSRLTSSSRRGEGFVQKVNESSFSLNKNSTGKYDCFYHFHNDITHTLASSQTFTAGLLQYIDMTIT